MIASLEEIPIGYRSDNVLVAYVRYLSKMVWPVHLAILYPLPKTISTLAAIAAAAALLAFTAAAAFGRKRSPYALVGWLWFLGTLVPVIGLVQIGHAAMADRYTYFPSIGVFIILTFAVRDWASRVHFSPAIITAAAVLVLGGCLFLTENQLHYWRDDESLFSHDINVTRNNEPAHLCLGLAFETEGREADALAEYRIALKMNPYRVKTYSALAHALVATGQTNEALADLREALRLYPQDVPSRDYLASLLTDSGRTSEALAELREAMRLYPPDSPPHDDLATLLANLLADSGRTNEALAEFQEAVRANPKNAELHDNLGAMLVELGRFDEAMEQYAAAARLDPADWRAPYLTGKALLKQGRDAEAMDEFRAALRLDPDNFQILAYTAHVLAATEDSQIRDGKTALAFASKANLLTGGSQPYVLDALGMACAETGDFTNAVEVAQRALDLANAAKMKNQNLQDFQQRLQLYKNRQPWCESFLATNAPPNEARGQ